MNVCAEEAAVTRREGHGPIALVVDDHDAVRRALCERIRASFGECRLREAASVEDALRIIGAERVDLVLMDFRLPGKNGAEGARLIRERSPSTAVVMVSGFDDPAHRSAASRAGVCAFVSKRAIGRELVPAIERAIDRKR